MEQGRRHLPHRCRLPAGLTLVLLAITCAHARAADTATWRVTENRYFHAISDASDSRVRELLTGLEKFRVFAQKFATVTIPPDAPRTNLIIFNSILEFHHYTPDRMIASFIKHDKNNNGYIVMPATDRGLNALHAIRHEYVHILMRYHRFRLPTWYREGLAEFLSTVKIEGRDVTVGIPPSDRNWFWYNRAGQKSYDKLVGSDEVPFKKSNNDIYMQYWLLARYMLMDSNNARLMNKYIALYNSGMDSLKAFKLTFGESPTDLARDKIIRVRHFTALRFHYDFPGMDTHYSVSNASEEEISRMHALLENLDRSHVR